MLIAIVAISAETLTLRIASLLGDIAKVTPALRLDPSGSFFQPTIRGVDTAITTSGGGRNGIYVDGCFSANREVASSQLLPVQSIQVLKGLPGTLFGRDTTGGSNLLTATDPSTTPSAQATLSYVPFNAAKAQGYASFGLTDTVAMNLEGVYGRGDGLVTNVVVGRQLFPVPRHLRRQRSVRRTRRSSRSAARHRGRRLFKADAGRRELHRP